MREDMQLGNSTWFVECYLPGLKMADLYALFQFVSIDYNKQFGSNKYNTKELVHERYNSILEELNKRAYGRNPYRKEAIKVDGETPENIDLSKFDE